LRASSALRDYRFLRWQAGRELNKYFHPLFFAEGKRVMREFLSNRRHAIKMGQLRRKVKLRYVFSMDYSGLIFEKI